MNQQHEFQKQDYVQYGESGVCIVDDICRLDFDGADKERLYYRMHAIHDEDSIIFSPVDGTKVPMRRLISPEEARELLEGLSDLEHMEMPEKGKFGEAALRQMVHTCDCGQWLKLIKTLHATGQARARNSRPAAQIDQKYLDLAGRLLFGELAVVGDTTPEAVQEEIYARLEACA